MNMMNTIKKSAVFTKFNKSLCQLVNVLLAIDKTPTVPQNALDCGPGLCWIEPGLWVQLSHSLCLEYVWQVYTPL